MEGAQVIITLQRQWTASLLSLILLFLSVFANAGDEYITYLHPDIQGSPLVATNDQGLVIWQESYAPWGQRELKDTASANPALGSSVWYTGQAEEQSLGLYYYGARWYSPDIAQFYSIDPASVTVDNPRSFGRYLYANNNPIRFTDPDGRTAVDIVNKRGRGVLLEGGCCAVPRGGAITSIGPRYFGNEGGGFLGARASGSSAAAEGAVAKNAGTYRPDRALPRDKHGNPVPDANAPHTQLGAKSGRKGDYTQAREWGSDANGKLVPKRDIDFTDHGRRQNHPSPHQHDYIPNPTGGTHQRSREAKPLELP